MVIRGKGAQPTDARSWVQAATWVLLCGAAPMLAGCSSAPSSINPVNWWHSLEGGEIAKQRPPPPGMDQPYPNLATVPAKPEAPDPKALVAITQGLVADRAHADYLAATTPLADPSSPAASPALFGQGTLPPPPPAGVSAPAGASGPASAANGHAAAPSGATPMASASLPAASAPPAPSNPAPAPSAAPRRPVESTPLAAPTAAVAPPPQAATPMAGAGALAAPPANAAPNAAQNAPAPPGAVVGPPSAAAAMPPIPAAPPAPPTLSGPGAPAAAPMVVASASPPAAPAGSNATTVEFVPGSAALPPGAADVLKSIAARRGQAVVAITGYGEAASSDPDVQSAALSLGLSRAQVVANALTGDGVPAAAVRVSAEAGGRGASVRLVH